METKAYRTYEEATQDYLDRFRALRDAPPAKSKAVTRGAADIPVDTLIECADSIADISASVVPLAQGYLEAPNPTLREGISGHILAQAAAELQVATELIHIVASEAAGPAATTAQAPRGTTRAARGASLREAIDGMEKAISTPVSVGLAALRMVRRAAIAADTPEEAKKALEQTAALTAIAISQRVVEAGGDLASKLVFDTEWSAVIEGAGLMSKKVTELLNSVKEGLGTLLTKAMAVAAKTLLNVYDKILALLGKDIENEARKRIQDWLEKIKQEGKIEAFDYLVAKIYRVDDFKKDLAGWIGDTSAETGKINATITTVEDLSQKFIVLVGRINKISDIAGLAKFIKMPQVHVVITGIRVALLASLVYAGHDYIGYAQIRFLNLTKGVAEVIKENLL